MMNQSCLYAALLRRTQAQLRWLLVLSCWLVLIGWLNVAVHAAPAQQAAEKKLVEIQTQILKSQYKLEKDRGAVGKLEKQLRESEQLIGQLNQQHNTTESTLAASRQQIQKLAAQKQGLMGQLSKHQSALYAQIRSEYLYGGQEKLKLLLNQQEPAKLGRTLVYYDYLHRARLQEIEQVRHIFQSVNKVQDELVAEQNTVVQIQSSLQSQKQQLEAQQQKRKTVLASLNASVSTEQTKLASLEEDEKQLKELIKNLQETLANIPVIDQSQGFQELKGQLYWPVVGKPTNQFGQQRNSARRTLNWQGVFIPSSEGNNVRSIFHGRIAFAEWMRGLGLLIIVDHGNGYMSLYGHNQSLYKQPGEWVNAGDRIATVGKSGGNARAGLYFEIRQQGKPVNPEIWCKKPAAVARSG